MSGFKSLLKSIEDAFEQDLPFVAYRAPNKRLVKRLIQSDNQLHVTDQYNESGFVFAPFNNVEDSVLIPFENANYAEAILEEMTIVSDNFLVASPSELEKEKHIDLVRQGIQHIESGEIKKIVLSRKETMVTPNFSPIGTFNKLLNTYDNALVYIWYHPAKGLWLGATPEKLISLSKDEFETVSLAGTQAFQGADVVDWGKKERAEQHIVTQYIVSSLKPIVQDIFMGNLETVKAGNLLHLSTKIWGTLKSANHLRSVLNELHPTPAVCGMPKFVAKNIILKCEDYNREFYTGFLGEINMNNCSNLFVNLRCMKVENTLLSLFLGGGITQDSIAENEWLETVEKSKVMKRVLRN